MATPEKTVFISHSTQDQAAVSALCAAFDQAGLEYWISSRDIPNGATWSEAIMSGLNNSQAMVLVYSAHSNQSPHVKRELERAVSKRISIIPFRIEDVPMSLDMEYYISTRQWTEASNPPTEKQLEDLIGAVRRTLDSGEGSGRGGGTSRPKNRSSMMIRLAAAVLVVALSIFALQKYLGKNDLDTFREPVATNSLADSLALAGGDSLDIATEEAAKPEETEIRPRNVPVDYGLVTFTSQPTGARVILDGTFIGETPLHDFRVAGGSMEAHFMKNGYERRTRSFSVANGGSRAVDAILTRIPGSLAIRTEPAGATLLLDGRTIGTSPWTFPNLQKGWHTVKVSMPGYVDRIDSVEVWFGQEASREITLEELKGQLTVEVIPSGRVLIDGSLKPTSGNGSLLISLKPGSYEVEARSPLYGSWFKTVEIKGQDSQDLVFDFTREYTCTVWSEPRNAAIYVNGRFTEKYTPAMLRLRPGKRSIQVDKDGYLSSAPRVFSVEADIVERVDFVLKKSP